MNQHHALEDCISQSLWITDTLENLQQDRKTFRRYIRQAMDVGVPAATIAKACNLSRQRIYQILAEEPTSTFTDTAI